MDTMIRSLRQVCGATNFRVDDHGDLPREALAKYTKEMIRKSIDHT